jgi:site-specific DNA recombinase
MEQSATPLRAGVYGRESKGKQKSVDDQVSLGLRLIEERPGWTHAGTYDDGSSASRFATKARKDWERLAVDLEQHKLDVLVVWEITRGSREPVEGFTWLNLCRDNGVLIYVMTDEELYDPRKTRHYDTLGRAILDGAKESNTTSDRVLRGVRAAAANGAPHGQVLYGYERRYDPETKEFVEQRAHAERAPVVREIFRRIARADPIVHVVNDLNERGIPGPAGGNWNRQTVRKMIRNRSYLGQRVHGDAIYAAVWPALVSEIEWRAANRVLDDPNRRRTKPGQKKWLLSYIALSKCGSPMHGVVPHDGRKAGYHCLKDGCTGVGQFELDEYVTRLVVARLSRPDAHDLFSADDSEIARAAEEVKALEDRLEEWRQSGARGETTPATLAVIERDLTPQIEAARRRRIAATVPAALADLVTTDDVRKVWDGLPLAGRREVVQTLFEEIKVGAPGNVRLGRWSTDDDRLQAAADRVTVVWKRREHLR